MPDAHVQRTESTAVVRCKYSQETWHLVCRNNQWIGDIKNCSKPFRDGKIWLYFRAFPNLEKDKALSDDSIAHLTT